MQLLYRGAKYDYSPRGAEVAQEANVFRAIRPTFNLMYRGSVYFVDPNAELKQVAPRSIAKLSYRGTDYALNGWTASTPETAPVAPLHRQKASPRAEVASAHRDNLHRNVQRRLQVAQERGDQNLVNLLERELQQLA